MEKERGKERNPSRSLQKRGSWSVQNRSKVSDGCARQEGVIGGRTVQGMLSGMGVLGLVKRRLERIGTRTLKSVQKKPSKKGKRRIGLFFCGVIGEKSEEEHEGYGGGRERAEKRRNKKQPLQVEKTPKCGKSEVSVSWRGSRRPQFL